MDYMMYHRSCEFKMYYRRHLACVLQGAALLLPRGAPGAAEAAECGAGPELTCTERWREHDVDEEALIQVRPDSRDESRLLSRLVAVGRDDISKSSSSKPNSSKDVADAINSTIQGAVDKANDTLSNAMDAVNGALGWLTDALGASRPRNSSNASNASNATGDGLGDWGSVKAEDTEFDCEAGLSEWEAGWSDAKKEWCCENEGKGWQGCKDADNASTSTEPATLGAGVEPANATTTEPANATATEEVGNILGASPCKDEAPCGEATKGSKIAPFGDEEVAAELERQAAKTQDALVEAQENAQVAEIKRAIFRSLTRLRAAQIKEFDTIARLETQAIDEYNDKHHYLAENPLEHISTGEQDPSLDKYTSFHD